MADPPALDLAFWDADAYTTAAAADADADADADVKNDTPARLGPSMYVTLFEGASGRAYNRTHTT
jgi:hypothetical protein